MSDDDDALLRRLRTAVERADPPPGGLADAIIAALAVDDLTDEYALLTFVESSHALVRGDADTATLQFSDGTITVLVHVSQVDETTRRVDGWVDASPREVSLVGAGGSVPAHLGEQGRFELPEVPAGLTRLELVLDQGDAPPLPFRTPQFEI